MADKSKARQNSKDGAKGRKNEWIQLRNRGVRKEDEGGNVKEEERTGSTSNRAEGEDAPVA
jgi:hypothetical protein